MNYLKSAACPCMYFYQSLGKWMIFVVLFVISSGVMGQKVIESNLLGNWANTGTGAWEYGFYEDGAVAFSDFWKYKHVKLGRKQTEVVLENGNRTVVLKIKQGKNGNISIARDNEKGEIFRPCNGKDFVAWEGVDTVSFSKPLVITDTVTICGYIRNLDKVTHPALRGYTFTCGYNGLLEEEEGEIVAPRRFFRALYASFCRECTSTSFIGMGTDVEKYYCRTRGDGFVICRCFGLESVPGCFEGRDD
ncbi:hypothetical protein [Butyricimonas paravirosa]|uniref:hypothetical protein n=1 Tax=Butyricimonas paravirosa TaxID=1472417 RepID=UPI00210B413C|nr:hypothetical protein [Butyricimonas paravirosa]MCQ4873081.1 hypothetical protein [Butyricimonas paravirosa]